MSALGLVLFQSCVYQSNLSESTVAGRWSDFAPGLISVVDHCGVMKDASGYFVCWLREVTLHVFAVVVDHCGVMKDASCYFVCWLREVTLHVFAGGSSCSWWLWCNERYRWLFSVCWLREVILHVFAGGSSCGWSLWCNEGRKWLFCVCWLREVTLHVFAGVRAEPRGSADAWLHAFSPSGLCYLFPWRHRPGYFNTGKLFAFILYRDTDLDILT